MLTKKLFVFAFVFLFLFSFGLVDARSIKNHQQSPQEAGFLIIETAYGEVHPLRTDFYIHTHVYNGSNALILSTGVNCSYHFYLHGRGGDEHISTGVLEQHGAGFSNIINGSLINKTGEYSTLIWCYTTDEGGFFQYSFDVTPNGKIATEGDAIFYVGFLFVLLILMGGCLFLFVRFDNLLNRVAMIGLMYLLLLTISFLGWNMASDFLTSAPFLIDFLRIIFFVLIISAFPLLIGGFVWYFLMLWKIKEIQRLMTKGFDFDEAEERVNRRRR